MSRKILWTVALSCILTVAASPCWAQTDSMYVDANGDVGVGTSTPSASLHVQRNDGTAQLFVEETSGTVAARDLLVLTNPGATRFLFNNSDSGQKWEFKLNAGGGFAINDPSHAGGELLLSTSGDLSVLGDVYSNTCSGSPCAPDYVFDDGYQLMPVAELESFVRQNKHLPGVPSAQEMSGPVNLGEMQMTLLEKVEQLTLYVIALDRENQQLREKVDQLSQRSPDDGAQ